MRILPKVTLTLFLMFLTCTAVFPQKALKTEYLVDPIGLDTERPRLNWQMDDERIGAIQSAYRIKVAAHPDELKAGKNLVWDSGKIQTADQLVAYKGNPLKPFTSYYWSVEVWDKEGDSLGESSWSTFETGMMDESNWQGAWVSDGMDVDQKPAPYFRKQFSTSKKVKKARAYIAVAGLYELSINGQRIGNHVLDPAYTRFDRRVLYVTHDVTEALQEGENAIGVLLGNGWYNHQSTAVWYFHQAPWRNRPAFCMDVKISYEDGSEETVSTGKGWKTALSPVIFNSIYTAEHYDARLEQAGWDKPGFDESEWKDIVYRSAPADKIVAQVMPPIRYNEELPAKDMEKINDTTFVFDLGRNISGVSEIKVSGKEGTVLRLKHGERLAANGRVDMSNIDVHYRPTDDTDPFQTDIFILKGSGEETFKAKFNYKGFQYVEVTASHQVNLSKESLKGHFMYSDVPKVGQISSSNPTLNGIWEATNNSYLSNLFGYPTDCPQREKNGWTGDGHIAIETGLYSYEGIKVYEKWLDDHRDEQQPNGVLPAIIPTSGWGYEWANGPDWTSTICIIPWNVYLFYGDQRILEENYEAMKKYVDHITEISPDGLTSWGLGDWVPVKSQSPVEYTSSAYYCVDARILAKTAALLGNEKDHQKYAQLADKIKEAINQKYLDPETGIYGSGLQTELSVALQWDLVPEDLRSKVAANLAKRVEEDGFHLDVGLLGTKAILNALSENGYADAAYRIAAQETYPSWGWWIVNGATTLYENWKIDAKSDISMNHIMFGEIGAWIYKALGGIKPDPAQPGFKHVLLEPHFVDGLENFKASHESPYGQIVSSWKKEGKNKIAYDIQLPANSTATLLLPKGVQVRTQKGLEKIDVDARANKETYRVSAGSYRLEIRL
ncbi:glycoside hydrolase family 78 protein [Echinicola sediminis]